MSLGKIEQESLRSFGFVAALLVAIFACLRAPQAAQCAEPETPEFDAAALEFFENKVRPLLAARCFECHSGKSPKVQGGLRLDSRSAALKGGDTGPAVVPKNVKESLFLDAVNYGDLYQMPPKSKLPAEEIAVFTKWVELGAPWPKEENATSGTKEQFNLAARKAAHWCWQPVRRLDPPKVRDLAWPAQALDQFVLAGLEERGLAPSPSADRRALIRRVYFDLIGLPPTVEEVESFVQDESDRAFERVVDRLLDSPHFGERWARHWMDLVRYAETFGHEFDYPIPHATAYRDYLIRAFNADVPYNQFVLEHLAGDLLPEPRRHPQEGYNESIIGTGFWWFGEQTHAPVDVRGDEAGRVDNQLDVMTKTFLGLTVACARCHDHKFDPISTKDYYALAGFVKSSRRQEAMLDPHGKIAAGAAALREEHLRASRELAALAPRPSADLAAEIARYLLAARELLSGSGGEAEAVARAAGVDAARLARWVKALSGEEVKQTTHPLYPFAALARQPAEPRSAEIGAIHKQLLSQAAAHRGELFADFSQGSYEGWFATGEAFGERPIGSQEWDAQARGLRLAAPGMANSGALSHKLRGVLRSPTFTLKTKHILYKVAGQGAQVRLIIDGYTMDTYNGLLFGGAAFNVDTKGQLVWHVQSGDVGRYLGHRAHIELIDHGDGWLAVDEIRFSDAGAPTAEPSRVALEALDAGADSLATLAAELGKTISKRLAQWHEKSAPPSVEVNEFINWCLSYELFDLDSTRIETTCRQLEEAGRRLDQIASDIPAPRLVLAMTDGTGEDERVYVRGNPRTLGEASPRQILEALRNAQPFEAGPGSGRLALARLLTDPENPLTYRVYVNRVWFHLLGRGLAPSVDNFGVLGQAPTHPELLDYLARQFESQGFSTKKFIKSVVLSSTYQMSSAPTGAGEELDPENLLWRRALIRRLEGEAIRDAMLALSGRLDRKQFGGSVPVHLTPFMQGRGRPGGSGPLDGAGRRSLYVEVRRNFLPPMMLAFDTPIPFSTMGRRNVSNVPAQALILMNDPFVIQQAEAWAKRLLSAAENTAEQRIEQMYLEAFGRPPTELERSAALAFLDEQGREHGLTPDAARVSSKVWADLCHVAWNSKEFIFLR